MTIGATTKETRDRDPSPLRLISPTRGRHGGTLGLLAALGLALAASCGPKQGPSEEPETAAAAEAAPAEAAPAEEGSAEEGSAEVHFDDMSHEEKLNYMGTVVMPRMKQLFEEHEAEEHAAEAKAGDKGKEHAEHHEHEFKCTTCHGDNAKEVGYEMPNKLFALPAEKTIESAREMDEDSTRFMLEKVVPTMAELLGEKPAEGGVGEGFGCFHCHRKE